MYQNTEIAKVSLVSQKHFFAQFKLSSRVSIRDANNRVCRVVYLQRRQLVGGAAVSLPVPSPHVSATTLHGAPRRIDPVFSLNCYYFFRGAASGVFDPRLEILVSALEKKKKPVTGSTRVPV